MRILSVALVRLARLGREEIAFWERGRRGLPGLVALLALAAACGAAWRADRRDGGLGARVQAQLGHVVAVRGSVWSSGRSDTVNRLPAGVELRVPLRAGDVIRVGEDSSAELLFFGGETLRVGGGGIVELRSRADGGADPRWISRPTGAGSGRLVPWAIDPVKGPAAGREPMRLEISFPGAATGRLGKPQGPEQP